MHDTPNGEGETFGSRVKRKRREHRLTQRQLAVQLKIDFTYLSKLENDEPNQSPGEELVGRLALLLEDDREYLLDLAGKVAIAPLRHMAAGDSEIARFLRRLPELPKDRLRKVIDASQDH